MEQTKVDDDGQSGLKVANKSAFFVVDDNGHLNSFLYSEYKLEGQLIDKDLDEQQNVKLKGTPSVALDTQGRLMILTLTQDGFPFYKRQRMPGVHVNLMTNWYNMNLHISHEQVPDIVAQGNGNVQVIVGGYDGGTYVRTLRLEGWDEKWFLLTKKDSQKLSSKPHAILDSKGNTRVFGYGVNGEVYTTALRVDADDNDWDDWTSIGMLS
eukprot:TRINITY_DN3064_c2_g1_i4.p1 TRINITY_DN3064_c2_g1~~TRINITY_DN3064_c2_g1_i4.p1  ORF type:complete len:210 (+),score=64.93 TRINITY_DN3064_c2_g1_i4:278-907(+)